MREPLGTVDMRWARAGRAPVAAPSATAPRRTSPRSSRASCARREMPAEIGRRANPRARPAAPHRKDRASPRRASSRRTKATRCADSRPRGVQGRAARPSSRMPSSMRGGQRGLRVGRGKRLVLQHQRAKTPLLAAPAPPARARPRRSSRPSRSRRRNPLRSRRATAARREKCARRAGRRRDRPPPGNPRAASGSAGGSSAPLAVGKRNWPARAGPPLRDAVGIGQGQHATAGLARVDRLASRERELAPQLPRRLARALGGAAIERSPAARWRDGGADPATAPRAAADRRRAGRARALTMSRSTSSAAIAAASAPTPRALAASGPYGQAADASRAPPSPCRGR